MSRNLAIWMYGLAKRLIIAPGHPHHVSYNNVSVNAGRVPLYNRSLNGVEASTLARDGNTGYRDANNKIRIYATKNSGKDIVVKVVVLIVRKIELRYRHW